MVEAYSTQEANSWTRIEMLIELYDATIAALEDARDAQRENRESDLYSHLLRGNRLMFGIIAGINRDVSEIGGDIERLCLFVVSFIRERNLDPAIKVLQTLRDGFEGIREQAIELERQGEVPDLSTDTSLISVA
ncbi:MAG: hypothetical protein KDA38_11670 [Planctomycetales bacterium]|nr:hypothetical protein [Planctomycetales bacterium]